MIALSTGSLVRFTPDHRAAEPVPPVYLLRVGSIIDRAMVEAELAGPPNNAGRVNGHELREVITAGIRALLAGSDDLGRALDALAAVQNGDADADQTGLIDAIEGGLADAWPPYAALRAREERRGALIPAVSARRFLRGWEGIDVVFALGSDGCPTDACLRALPVFDLIALGVRAYRMLYVGEDARPLSPPPSMSAAAPATSTGGGKANGRSQARSGLKTPR